MLFKKIRQKILYLYVCVIGYYYTHIFIMITKDILKIKNQKDTFNIKSRKLETASARNYTQMASKSRKRYCSY